MWTVLCVVPTVCWMQRWNENSGVTPGLSLSTWRGGGTPIEMWTLGEEGPCVHRLSWTWLSDGQGELSSAWLDTSGWSSIDKGEGWCLG